MNAAPPQLRPATAADIEALNGVVERAFMTWNLPERVKRLSLPSYRYRALDLDFQHIVVAETPIHGIIGVAAWEPAEPRDLPSGLTGLLLHGLYVEPAHIHRGIGSQQVAQFVVNRDGERVNFYWRGVAGNRTDWLAKIDVFATNEGAGPRDLDGAASDPFKLARFHAR